MPPNKNRKASDPEESTMVDEYGNIIKDYGPSPDIPSLSVPNAPMQGPLLYEKKYPSISPIQEIVEGVMRSYDQEQERQFGGRYRAIDDSIVGQHTIPPQVQQLPGPPIFMREPSPMAFPGKLALEEQAAREMIPMTMQVDPSQGFTSPTIPAPPGASPTARSSPMLIPTDTGRPPIQLASTTEPIIPAQPVTEAVASMRPMDMIRQGVRLNDPKMIAEGRRGLITSIVGEDTFLKRLGDVNNQIPQAEQYANKVIMEELGRQQAVEAVNLGLIHPQELLPGQTRPTFAHLIPTEPFQFTPEGEPVSQVQTRAMPAQPRQAPSGVEADPTALLTEGQEAVAGARREALSRPRVPRTTAQGEREFDVELRARIAAFQQLEKRLPSPVEFLEMVKEATGRHYVQEPRPGSLPELRMTGQIKGEAATTGKTMEQIATERLMRPHQIMEAQARTTNLLASANEHMAKASDAARKGELAAYRAELEQVRTAIMAVNQQHNAAMITYFEGDLGKEDQTMLLNYINQLAKSGIALQHRAGILGLDIGRPNLSIEQAGPAAGVPMPPSVSTPESPRPFQGIDPFQFAPRPPDLGSPIPSVPQAPPLQPQEEPQSDVTPEKKEYRRLRRSGLSMEEAIAEMKRQKKAPKE